MGKAYLRSEALPRAERIHSRPMPPRILRPSVALLKAVPLSD
jgi:hypothetical protein